MGFCYGPYLTVLNQTPTNPYHKKIESRKVIRPERLVTQGNIKMIMTETKIVEKRNDLLKNIQVGLEEAIFIREYYRGDEYECLTEDAVINGLIKKCGIDDIEMVRLVSKLSDTIFDLYPTG